MSSLKDEVVRKEIGNLLITDLARAETLDDVWSCELDGPKGKLESSHRDEVLRASLT